MEQKNGAIVRPLVGYGRWEGVRSAQALSRLYAAARLHTNLFQPSFKLKTKAKTRVGARIIKRYHPLVPPVSRAIAHAALGDADRRRLQALRGSGDPVLLLAEIRAAQEELGHRVESARTQIRCAILNTFNSLGMPKTVALA